MANKEFERRHKKSPGYFLKLRKSWEYLREKPKFIDHFSADSLSHDSNGKSRSSKKGRPVGRDKSKATSKLDEVVEKVRDKFGSSGDSIAQSLDRFGGGLQQGITAFAAGMNEVAYLEHCDPETAKKYANLKLQLGINQMESELRAQQQEKQRRPCSEQDEGQKNVKRHRTIAFFAVVNLIVNYFDIWLRFDSKDSFT